MNHDHRDDLRQLARERAIPMAAADRAAELLVVVGAKSGVGTTTVAANLALALARQGRRTVFVDADLEHGGHTQLGLQSDRGSVLDVLSGRRGLHEVLERGPSGIQVLSGCWQPGEVLEFSAAAQDRFIAGLKQLAPFAEVVVVDAGCGGGPLVRRLWQAAGGKLVVTTAEDTSVMQCYAAIKVLSAGAISSDVHSVVNRENDSRAAADAHARIAEACGKFLGTATVAAGTLALDPEAVPLGVRLFPPRHDNARAADRAAEVMWTALQAATFGTAGGPTRLRA